MVYETVYDAEIVQVPVTVNQTQYRTEYKTQTVPVTRTVVEQVPGDGQPDAVPHRVQDPDGAGDQDGGGAGTRDGQPDAVPDRVQDPLSPGRPRPSRKWSTFRAPVTVYVPRQQTVNQQVTKTVYNPVTTTQKQQLYVTVQKPITRTVLQPRSVTVMTSKVQTSVVPETYTDRVPVTTTRQVVEEQGCYVTQAIPVTTTVPVAGCSTAGGGHGGLFSRCSGGAGCGHKCGHRCGGGCGLCGGYADGGYTTQTSCTYQQVYVSRPVVRSVSETNYVNQTKTRLVPVQQVVQVPETQTQLVPVTVNDIVSEQQVQEIEHSGHDHAGLASDRDRTRDHHGSSG